MNRYYTLILKTREFSIHVCGYQNIYKEKKKKKKKKKKKINQLTVWFEKAKITVWLI